MSIASWYNSQVEKLMAWLYKNVDIANLDLDFVKEREHFIPIRYSLLVNEILKRSSLSEDEKKEIGVLGEMFEEHYHLDYHKDFLKLKDAFAPFNPDQETVYEVEFSEEEKAVKRKELMDGISYLLEKSNYLLMSNDNFNKCLRLQPFGGLSVQIDTEKFKQFHVYYRGIREVEVTDKLLWIFKRNRRTIQFCRIFVLAEYITNPSKEEIQEMESKKEKPLLIPEEQSGNIIAKQFRDVPIEHLKIVAPEVTLNLPFFDKFKIGSTFLGGLLTSAVKFVFAAVFNTVVFIILLFGIIVALIKSIFGFFNSKTKCMKQFSESLYHKNLSNNVAAVSSLLDQAETQEVKEALLSYYMLYVHRDQLLTMREMDDLIEAELKSAFNFDIDFEEKDALDKLIKKGLVTVIPGETEDQNRYKVLAPIKAALQHLDEIWDNYRTVE